MGATGYMVSACRGKGEHDTVDDPFANITRVRIELLVPAEIGHKILIYVDSPGLKSHPEAAELSGSRKTCRQSDLNQPECLA
jgi:hypothetical protein